MESKEKLQESKGISKLVGVAAGGIFALALAIFLFLDWRVRDVCKWSRFEEMPSLPKQIDLISSIFRKDQYHIYFVQDYKCYSSKEKLRDDVKRNQKEIVGQLKEAGFRDDEIEISPIGKIYEYKGLTPWSEKSKLFGMNGMALDVKTADEKLYKSFSDVIVNISHQPKTNVQTTWPIKPIMGRSIHKSSRHVFSFSFTNSILKILDCTRVSVLHQTLVEEKSK